MGTFAACVWEAEAEVAGVAAADGSPETGCEEGVCLEQPHISKKTII